MFKENNRIYYIDVLRVISCLAVIMIHVCALYLENDVGSFNFFVGNVLDSMSRFAVPVFVMISGALFLDTKYKFSREKLIKHLKKMIIFFVLWSFCYTVIFEVLNKKSIGQNIFKSFIVGHYHLWYIYLIISLYLITPLLKLWINDLNKKYIEYFIVLSLIFGLTLPQINTIILLFNKNNLILSSILNNVNLNYIGGYASYFIMGWYIHNYDIKNIYIYILGGISLFITISGTWLLSNMFDNPIFLYDNLSVNIFFYSCMIFTFIKNIFINKNTYNKIILEISKYSLGIYGIHVIIITVVNKIILWTGLNIAIINIPIVFIMTLLISLLCCKIMKNIPILKYMI